MGHWISENLPQVVAWIGAIVAFAFFFGKRLTRLETTDAHLIKTVDALQKTVSELSIALQGINSPRVGAIEAEAHAHDKRLAMLEQSTKNTDERLRQIEVAQHEIRSDLKVLMLTMSRIETRCGVAFGNENGKRNGGENGG